MSWIGLPEAVLGNPAFFFTYAVIQAGVLLVLIRYLDLYNRQPLGLLALAAVWGATGAAAISLAGNEFVKEMLSGDVREVFGDAIAAPIVEEAAKGVALLAAVGPVRWLVSRAGVSLFEGLGAGIAYGAAVGLGFGFTEDVYFLVERARSEGIEAGFDTFLYRRDFFGPAILHHAVFTAAFGAGLGLATSTTRRALKVALPLAGFALAVLMHAVNNGLVEFVVVLKYGVGVAADWVRDPTLAPAAADTAASVTRLMRVIDFYYLAMFFGVIVYWTIRQRRLIRDELEEEVDLGLIKRADHELMFDGARRRAADWRLLRAGQLEQLRHVRRLRGALAQLGLLKWRTRRVGASWSRVHRARREIATLSTYDVAPQKLPVPSSPLIGRERELDEIPVVLFDPDVRAVTLTGPGGTGKTRLSIELASRMGDLFSGGVYFVELAPVSDAELVPQAIADVLEVQTSPGESVVEALGDHLRDKHLLLVLDNFEQVTEAAPAVAQLLAMAKRLKVLVTSRNPLRIGGEHEVPIPPLALPDPKADVATASLAATAAVALFVARAQAANPEFELTDANAAAVAEICIGLDGLPLAIELAAARTNVLTPEAMLDRLGKRLQILTGGARDLPSRHQTLRSTIDWSYDMLRPTSRRCSPAWGSSSTARRSLRSRRSAWTPTRMTSSSSRTRRSTDSVRCSTRASCGDMTRRAGSRASRCSRRSASTPSNACVPTATSPSGAGATRATSPGSPSRPSGSSTAATRRCGSSASTTSSETSARRCTGHRRPAAWRSGCAIAGALPRYWSVRGLSDPPRWLAQALERDGDVPAPVRAKALYADGYAALDHGDFAHAEERFEAGASMYRELDEPRGTAACLAQLGFLLMSRGDRERAVELSEESVELAQLVNDAHIESVALSTLADEATRAGEYERARDMYEHSLELRRELGDRRNIANALLNVGRTELLRGEDERALKLLEQGLAIGREVGDTWSISVGLGSLGRLALRQGRRDEALKLLSEALQLAVERGGRRLAAECLAALAEAASRTSAARSARLFGTAEALRRASGVSLSPVELAATRESLDSVREALGEDEFRAQFEAGIELSTEDAVTYALSGT